MRLVVESHEIKAQMDSATIDLSKPYGHVVILEAVPYGDDGEKIEGIIEACAWTRNGHAVEPDADLGECPPWEFRIDALKGTERPGNDDLYLCKVTITEGEK